MSARNRELLNLFVVGIITSLGFASVYIARQEVVSTASLSYALFFFGLYQRDSQNTATRPSPTNR